MATKSSSKPLVKLPGIQEDPKGVHYHAHKHLNVIVPPGGSNTPQQCCQSKRNSCASLWSSVDNQDGSFHHAPNPNSLERFKPIDHNAIRAINGNFLALGGQLVESIGVDNAAVLMEVLNTIPKEDIQLREEFVESVSAVLGRFAKDQATIAQLNHTITEKDKQLLEERLKVAQKELERLKAKKLKTRFLKLCKPSGRKNVGVEVGVGDGSVVAVASEN